MGSEFSTTLIDVTTKNDRATMDSWLAEQSRSGWELMSVSAFRVDQGSAALVVLRREVPDPS